MSTVLNAGTLTFPSGQSFQPVTNGVAVPAGFTDFVIKADVVQVPATDSIAYEQQWSYDAGVTWRTSGTGVWQGGTQFNKGLGGQTTLRFHGGDIPQTPYPQRVRWVVDTTASETVTLQLTLNP